MANTFTQLHVQIVFAVLGRQNLIRKENKEAVHKFITSIVQKRDNKMLAIHCMPDHLHMFVGIKPTQSISDLVRDVKTNSSTFITEQKIVPGKFNWQEGYGAFSYSHSHIAQVGNYIDNQEEHHRKRTFKDEYLDFLNKFEIQYDEKYLFEWIE